MKKYIIIFILFTSCQTLRNLDNYQKKTDIVYLLPRTITRILEERVIKECPNVYFYLQPDSGNYTIYSGYIFKKTRQNRYSERTNRKLFINGNFYPLVFEADKLFGCIESPRDILTSFLRSDSIAGSREFTIYDGFHITFKKDGTLVDSGSFHIYDKAPDKIISIKRQNELK